MIVPVPSLQHHYPASTLPRIETLGAIMLNPVHERATVGRLARNCCHSIQPHTISSLATTSPDVLLSLTVQLRTAQHVKGARKPTSVEDPQPTSRQEEVFSATCTHSNPAKLSAHIVAMLAVACTRSRGSRGGGGSVHGLKIRCAVDLQN